MNLPTPKEMLNQCALSRWARMARPAEAGRSSTCNSSNDASNTYRKKYREKPAASGSRSFRFCLRTQSPHSINRGAKFGTRLVNTYQVETILQPPLFLSQERCNAGVCNGAVLRIRVLLQTQMHMLNTNSISQTMAVNNHISRRS